MTGRILAGAALPDVGRARWPLRRWRDEVYNRCDTRAVASLSRRGSRRSGQRCSRCRLCASTEPPWVSWRPPHDTLLPRPASAHSVSAGWQASIGAERRSCSLKFRSYSVGGTSPSSSWRRSPTRSARAAGGLSVCPDGANKPDGTTATKCHRSSVRSGLAIGFARHIRDRSAPSRPCGARCASSARTAPRAERRGGTSRRAESEEVLPH